MEQTAKDDTPNIVRERTPTLTGERRVHRIITARTAAPLLLESADVAC